MNAKRGSFRCSCSYQDSHTERKREREKSGVEWREIESHRGRQPVDYLLLPSIPTLRLAPPGINRKTVTTPTTSKYSAALHILCLCAHAVAAVLVVLVVVVDTDARIPFTLCFWLYALQLLSLRFLLLLMSASLIVVLLVVAFVAAAKWVCRCMCVCWGGTSFDTLHTGICWEGRGELLVSAHGVFRPTQ